jgi:UPF0288 family protein (methanogenesis marker protein 3)
MGVITVSKEEERRIERLRKELRVTTKSGLIRIALTTLERRTEEERLRRAVEESVRLCATADKRENFGLRSAGAARRSVFSPKT